MQQEQAIAFDGCASPWMTAEPHSTAKIRGLPCARHRGSWMLRWGRGEVLNSPMCVPERQMCSKSCHCLSCDRTPLPCHAKTDVFKVLPLLVMRSHTTALSCNCTPLLVMRSHTTALSCMVHHHWLLVCRLGQQQQSMMMDMSIRDMCAMSIRDM